MKFEALDAVAIMLVCGIWYHRRCLHAAASKRIEAANVKAAIEKARFPFLPN